MAGRCGEGMVDGIFSTKKQVAQAVSQPYSCTEGTARLLWPGAELILVSCLGIAVGRSKMLVHAREGGSPLGAVPEGRELRWDLPAPRTEQEASCLGSRQSGLSR